MENHGSESNTQGSVTARVRAVNTQALPCPQTAITIAVDTSYVISKGGRNIGTGIYMMDNQKNNGSSGEGTLELSTCANVGDYIGFEVVPINPETNDKVAISGITVSQGNVFGGQGYPIPTPDKDYYWIGQAVNAGQQTYQVQIRITSGGVRPSTYYVNWDPFIKAQ